VADTSRKQCIVLAQWVSIAVEVQLMLDSLLDDVDLRDNYWQ